MSGGQWLRIDSHLLSSRTAARLKRELGAAGVAAWVGLLCACKRNSPAGEITFNSDYEALALLGLTDVRLLDNDGKEWELETLWRLLGRIKHVRRTVRGQLTNVRCTRWEQWQDDERRQDEREKKRRQRGINRRDTTGTRSGHVPENVPAENESESEKEKDPPKPPLAGGADVASLPTATTEAPAALAAPVDLRPLRDILGNATPQATAHRAANPGRRTRTATP